jgi:hypothetical protein
VWEHKRAAGGAAELVEPERRLTQTTKVHEEILSAEFVVSEEFEQTAVQLIRTGFADQIDDAASGV